MTEDSNSAGSAPSYAARFADEARQRDLDQAATQRWLEVIQNLETRGFPIILDQRHLSRLVGYDVHYLWGVSNDPITYYREFYVAKRSGGVRRILEPLPSLKEIQRWLVANLFYCFAVSKFAKAYVPRGGIRPNARFHRRQRLVHRLDVLDFFGSLKRHHLSRALGCVGYPQAVSSLISRLCTADGALPQGAPTSPVVSNIVMRQFDDTVGSAVLALNGRYTRYADDIFISGIPLSRDLLRLVTTELGRIGLRLNDKKSRSMARHHRQLVTGVVVNDGLRPPRAYRRSFRQKVYYIQKFGLLSHIEHIGEQRDRYLEHLIGVGQHIVHVHPGDRQASEDLAFLKSLKSKMGMVRGNAKPSA